MKVLVTGAAGQVGSELQALSAVHHDIQFVFTDRDALDITNLDAVMTLFEAQQPDWCLNCAAYTAVDKAETDTEAAFAINVTASEHLAQACAKYKTKLVHLSTDYVYHNQQNTPFVEGDATAPKGEYARTKLLGEQRIQVIMPQGALIIRTSWVYSSFGNNFVKTMLRLGATRDSLTVVADQIGSPTYARDLADAMLQIAKQRQVASFDTEIWHYSNEGVTSWYDFAHEIMELGGLSCKVSPIRSAQYPTPAQRPPFSYMDKTKIRTAFQLDIPHWRDSLKKAIVLIQAEAK